KVIPPDGIVVGGAVRLWELNGSGVPSGPLHKSCQTARAKKIEGINEGPAHRASCGLPATGPGGQFPSVAEYSKKGWYGCETPARTARHLWSIRCRLRRQQGQGQKGQEGRQDRHDQD